MECPVARHFVCYFLSIWFAVCNRFKLNVEKGKLLVGIALAVGKNYFGHLGKRFAETLWKAHSIGRRRNTLATADDRRKPNLNALSLPG